MHSTASRPGAARRHGCCQRRRHCSACAAGAAVPAIYQMGSIQRVVGLDAVLGARADQQEQRQATATRLVLSGAGRCRTPRHSIPLIVDNVMYVSGVRGVLVALDATTGKELWMSTLQAPDRGLAYWESKDRSDRRLILTASNGIREVDARTGQQILTFGTKGFVDMRVGTPRRNGGPNSSPGRVFENLLIVGFERRRGLRFASGRYPRVRRASAASSCGRSTRFRVPVNTDTRRGRRMRSDTPAARTRGAISRSTRRTVSCFCRPDRRRTISTAAIARATISSATACLRSTRARAKRLWHFQIVHHDLWDYDNAAAPKLLTVQSQRQADRDRRAGRQDRIPLRLRTQNRHAAVADRGAARFRRAKCLASSRRRRSRFRPSRRRSRGSR